MKLTNLQDYVEQKRKEYEVWQAEGVAKGLTRSMQFEDESLVWAIQDYLSMKGEFSAEDAKYLSELDFEPSMFSDEECGVNMVYVSPRGKTITFDDYMDNTKEYQSYWVEMCPHCRNKYRGILGKRADSGARGTCSVAGCDNEAEYYADFNEKEVRFIYVKREED